MHVLDYARSYVICQALCAVIRNRHRFCSACFGFFSYTAADTPPLLLYIIRYASGIMRTTRPSSSGFTRSWQLRRLLSVAWGSDSSI